MKITHPTLLLSMLTVGVSAHALDITVAPFGALSSRARAVARVNDTISSGGVTSTQQDPPTALAGGFNTDFHFFTDGAYGSSAQQASAARYLNGNGAISGPNNIAGQGTGVARTRVVTDRVSVRANGFAESRMLLAGTGNGGAGGFGLVDLVTDGDFGNADFDPFQKDWGWFVQGESQDGLLTGGLNAIPFAAANSNVSTTNPANTTNATVGVSWDGVRWIGQIAGLPIGMNNTNLTMSGSGILAFTVQHDDDSGSNVAHSNAGIITTTPFVPANLPSIPHSTRVTVRTSMHME